MSHSDSASCSTSSSSSRLLLLPLEAAAAVLPGQPTELPDYLGDAAVRAAEATVEFLHQLKGSIRYIAERK